MRLRYTRDKKIRVFWKDSADLKNPEFTDFTPEGETSDERGKKLLANPEHRGSFIEVKPPEPAKPMFICDVCGEAKKSKAGLGSHKRKHKEKQ